MQQYPQTYPLQTYPPSQYPQTYPLQTYPLQTYQQSQQYAQPPQPPTSKKGLYIGIAIAVIIIAGLIYYFYFNKSPLPNNTPTSGTILTATVSANAPPSSITTTNPQTGTTITQNTNNGAAARSIGQTTPQLSSLITA